ncbi:hypothetical protein EOI86_08215 [Hwanghaeella grinnelliae]|uniref:Phytanoyl-CoA dioxygenase n=2 Tax=Hwanghaeella grinnelliae TaxID=2500179 RepID=A0A3S3USW5_9PROT|nr:hypothetical protein EOI86_08215 [Hwanghaeella grinnelliae]
MISFRQKGWCKFPYDKHLADWIDFALPHARATVTDPAFAEWYRYGGTWFAGVNALPNDATGAVPGGPPISGQAVDFIRDALGMANLGADMPWDRAQISVCYPGYPKPMDGESKAVFDFRRNRDAAHVDGLLREGTERRRRLKEFHAFILGIPVVKYSENAAPFSLWEGSHIIFGNWFRDTFLDVPPERWGEVDITEGYQRIRKQVFETCERITIHAKPGEAYLAHRHILHGMTPWGENAEAGPDGRMIAYFRPALNSPTEWLLAS